jgi:hypothetical protein
MTDDSPNRALEAASAVVDGIVDDAAAADPALVAALSDVRAELRRPVSPPPGASERAILAALAQLGAAPPGIATAASLEDARLASARHRRRYSLLGVAAAIVLVAAGVAVLAGRDRTGTKSAATPSTTALAATTAAASAAGNEQAVPAGAPAGGADTAATAAPGATTTVPFTLDGPATVLPMVNSAEELRQFADGLGTSSTARSSTGGAPAPSPPCNLSSGEVLGMISYQGHPAFAVRDGDILRAVALADCAVLVQTP